MHEVRGRHRSRHRAAGVAAAVAVSVVLTGGIASGQFGATHHLDHDAGAGVVALSIVDGDGSLAFDATFAGMFPGETRQRLADLHVGGLPPSGTVDLATVTLTATSTPPSPLTSDTDHGLHLAVERCSVPWVVAGGTPALDDPAYLCPGATTAVVPASPVLGVFDLTAEAGSSLVGLGAVNHYRFTVSLPSTAPASMQGTTAAVTFTFDGTARDPGAE